MQISRFAAAILVAACVISNAAHAEVKVDQQSLGPDRRTIGASISPDGAHAAVLASKGSRYQVLVDGAPGPVIESLMSDPVNTYKAPSFWAGKVPILYSNDSAHYAYIAKASDNYVVYLDGKELVRQPIPTAGSNNMPLTFSPGGKHLFLMDSTPDHHFRIIVDGKPGPTFQVNSPIAMSPDGEHYAYTASMNTREGTWAIVDGRQVNYFGDNLQYTGRGVLLSELPLQGASALVLNGKPSIKALRLQPMWLSPDGKQIAIVITPNASTPSFLTVDGKKIDGTDGLVVEKVYFSPDGKRWAALCDTKSNARFMIIDGKKMQEYSTIPAAIADAGSVMHWRFVTDIQNTSQYPDQEPPVPGFTPDSSKFVYVASTGSQQFLEIEDQESDGYINGTTFVPVLSTTGHRVAVIGEAPNHVQHVLVDDKDQPMTATNVPGQGVTLLTFSPDGSHYAFICDHLYLDGAPQPGHLCRQYIFSPDSKHLAYQAILGDHSSWLIDGKVVVDQGGNIQRLLFSPDAQHVIWITSSGIPNTKDTKMLYLDGKQATHFDFPINGSGVNYVFNPDGSLTFIALTDGNIRRFTVTPSADMNLTSLLAAAPAAK